MTIYCVFCRDNGGYFLEKAFFTRSGAEDYRLAQGKYTNLYHVEEWEVD